jgi:hypothetical protein
MALMKDAMRTTAFLAVDRSLQHTAKLLVPVEKIPAEAKDDHHRHGNQNVSVHVRHNGRSLAYLMSDYRAPDKGKLRVPFSQLDPCAG